MELMQKINIPKGLYTMLPWICVLTGGISLFALQGFEAVFGLLLIWYGGSVLILRNM